MKQESKQDEATEEQTEVASKETTEETPEVTSTEEKATSERQRTEEEFRKLQGIMTKAINANKAKDATLQSVQNELQELRKRNDQQELDARRKEIEDASGEPELLRIVRERHRLDDEKQKFAQYTRETQEDVDRQYKDAIRLSEQHGVKISELFGVAKSTEQMELLAENLALKKAAEQAKGQDKVLPKDKGFRPDSNTSDAAPSDFKQLEKNFIADPAKYALEYKKALAKQGRQF